MSFFESNPITNETPVAENLFKPLQDGVYTLVCIDAKEAKTKNNDDILKLIFQVENTKRQLFANFMLTHAKAQTVQIAQGQIKALCERAGIPLPLRDSQQLLGATITTRVKVVPRSDKPDEYQNEIVFQQTKAKATTGAPAQAKAAANPTSVW